MSKLYVEEMHCPKCVERISKVLREAGIECSVSLDDKTVTVKNDASDAKAIEELDDIGFTAKKA